MPELPFDLESARAAGVIYGDGMKEGFKIDPEDAMIDGISKVCHETLITTNIKHFLSIEGVKAEGY